MDVNENLYGTTYFGGVDSCGIVYELTAASGYTSELLLYSFTGASDGCTPSALAIFSIEEMEGEHCPFSICERKLAEKSTRSARARSDMPCCSLR